MVNYSKRIVIYVLIGFLSFSSISISYNRGVHAMEWVGGALAFEEALKWLMASIGVVAGTGFVSDYWTRYGDDFEEYCIEQEITQQEVTEWQIKLCEGILDKASDCWVAFLNWINNDIISSSVDSDNIYISSNNLNDFVLYISEKYGLNSTSFGNINFNCIGLYGTSTHPFICYSTSNRVISLRQINNNLYWFNANSYIEYIDNRWVSRSVSSSNYLINGDLYINDNWFIDSSVNLSYNNIIISDSITNSDFNNLDNVNIDNLDIISSTTDNVEDSEVAIPMPGQVTSDNELSADTYNEIIEQINEGTLSLEDGIEQIQSLLQVIVYDTTTDQVVPEPSNGPQDKDDKIEETKANEAFTIHGLEEVFPFCIPWDIYLFMSILEADPLAPNINWPFRNPVTKEDIIVAVDLSPYNGVAQVVRYGFDLIFIVGLAMVTRSLIGAGGGDG